MRILNLMVFLCLGITAYSQELLTNGSFENVDPTCFTTSCSGSTDDCVDDRQVAYNISNVGEDPCFYCSGSFTTPYGDYSISMNPGFSFVPSFFSGTSIYQEVTLYPHQKLEFSCAVNAFCNDTGQQSLLFFALEDAPTTTGSNPLSLVGENYIFLGSEPIINISPSSNQGWINYNVTLDLGNSPLPSFSPEGKSYNYFLVMASETQFAQGNNLILLDNLSLQACQSEENFQLFYNVQQSGTDCGYTEFTIECNSPVSYVVWDFGDGNCTTTENEKTDHIYNHAGTYEVTITIVDEHGCLQEIKDEIVVGCDRCPGFNVDFSWTVDPDSYTPMILIDPKTGETIFAGCNWEYTFTDLSTPSTGNPIVSWDWDFGIGNSVTTQNPVRNMSGDDTPTGIDYEVCLTVTDSNDCSETFCQTVNVNCRQAVIGSPVFDPPNNEWLSEVQSLQVAPNPFTDYLEIQSSAPVESIRIMNAAGQVLHQQQGLNTDRFTWSAPDLQPGIYYLQVIDQDGKPSIEKVVRQ